MYLIILLLIKTHPIWSDLKGSVIIINFDPVYIVTLPLCQVPLNQKGAPMWINESSKKGWCLSMWDSARSLSDYSVVKYSEEPPTGHVLKTCYQHLIWLSWQLSWGSEITGAAGKYTHKGMTLLWFQEFWTISLNYMCHRGHKHECRIL